MAMKKEMSRVNTANTTKHSNNIISMSEARARMDAIRDSKSFGMDEEQPYIRYVVYGVNTVTVSAKDMFGDTDEIAAFSDLSEAKAYVTARDIWCKKNYPAYIIQDSDEDSSIFMVPLSNGKWVEQNLQQG